MSFELRVGLVIALVFHSLVFYGFAVSTVPRYEVVVSPSGLEVSLIAMKPKPKVEPKPVFQKKKEEVKEVQEKPRKSALEKEVHEVAEIKKVEEVLKSEKVEDKPALEPTKEQAANPLRGALSQASPLVAKNKPPKYSRVARARGYEGTVFLRVWVTSEGKVDRLEVQKSSGYKILDDSARRAIQKWRFVPAKRLGIAVASQVEIPIVFQLEN